MEVFFFLPENDPDPASVILGVVLVQGKVARPVGMGDGKTPILILPSSEEGLSVMSRKGWLGCLRT